jgi:hypothetical protein
MISFWAKPDLIEAIELGRRQLRRIDRSQFIRDAIAEKLSAMNVDYKGGAELMPDRMGKGGRPREAIYQIKPGAWSSNEQPPRPKGAV